MFTLRLCHPLYWPAWLGLAILWLIVHLPDRLQLWIGSGLGRLLYAFPGKLKNITQTNIQLCFPQLTRSEQLQLAKKNFISLGIGLIEAGRAWWLPDHQLQQHYQIHGMEYADQAFAEGKGIILLGPHFTCLEIIGRLLSMKYSFGVMYRPHKKPLISFIHERFRKKYYQHAIPSHNVRALIRALQQNIAIWYAYDIDGGKKRSVFAPFFGIPTASLTSVTRLVNLSGAAIIPISFYRRDDSFHYDIVLYPAIENFPTGDLQRDATQLNHALEIAILTKPEQYVWQYKRFKTRPQGEARFY